MAPNRSKSLYAIKECSTCGSWYTKECCSIGNLNDQIIVPDSSLHCAVCGTPVDGPYCHGCTLIRMKFEKDLFTYCVDNGVFQNFQDTSSHPNDIPTLLMLPREPRHFNEWGSEIRKKEQAYNEERNAAARRRMLSITFDDDDDSIPLGDIIARSKAITPDLPIEEPDNFLSMGDEHLDTIPSVEYLVPIPRESEGLSDNGSECDMPVCDESSPIFTVFSNPLFDSNDNFSSDDESLSEEEIQKDEFNSFSNPLYDIDDEIITNESNFFLQGFLAKYSYYTWELMNRALIPNLTLFDLY
ncbi:hypothetical protein Tco_0806019 [Tanacetum coccineum]